MDENCYAESIFIAPDRRMFNGKEYVLLCKRPEKNIAELVRDDMIQRGKHSIITQEVGGFSVWWC